MPGFPLVMLMMGIPMMEWTAAACLLVINSTVLKFNLVSK